jgi:hypothetical protein
VNPSTACITCITHVSTYVKQALDRAIAGRTMFLALTLLGMACMGRRGAGSRQG